MANATYINFENIQEFESIKVSASLIYYTIFEIGQSRSKALLYD